MVKHGEVCQQCHYPSFTELCENPACLEDKGRAQIDLINESREEAKEREEYLRQHRGIDYSLSFKKHRGVEK